MRAIALFMQYQLNCILYAMMYGDYNGGYCGQFETKR